MSTVTRSPVSPPRTLLFTDPEMDEAAYRLESCDPGFLVRREQVQQVPGSQRSETLTQAPALRRRPGLILTASITSADGSSRTVRTP